MYALQIEDLHKTYSNQVTALRGISLKIKEGDFFALLGPNGAGKSTTIGIICSLVNKTSGRVQIFDKDIDQDWSGAKAYIGVVPQEFNFNIFEKVENIVLNQAGFYGMDYPEAAAATKEALQAVDLWGKRNDVARALSGGMKRRLMIARAIVHKPKLLILDEPTAGVDIEIRRSMWEFLKKINQSGTTIILTTHYLEEAENLCRNIAIINHGKIIENMSVKQLLSTLQTQSFILDLKKPLNNVPIFPHMEIRALDADTLEIEVSAEVSLNAIFEHFSSAGIEIAGLRNKSNRLEALFLKLTTGQS